MQAADKHYVDAQVATAVPLTGGTLSGPFSATQIGALYQADQFPGADLGAKIQTCLNALNTSYGGTCDARNFTGNQSMGSNLTISTGNSAVLLPCATIATANQILVTAGTRNVALHGCAMRGGTAASGSLGGTVFAYSGTSAMVQVGDPTYAADTLGFHMDNVVINTTGAANAAAQGLVADRTQELDLESLYLLGNSNQTGMTLDGTGNYTGGTFLDDEFGGFGTAVNAIGHQVANPATTDWMNASAFIRLHIDCPTSNGSPINGTYGINLLEGDGNTFTGGDVEGCATAMHLGPNAQNNTIVGLRNENSTNQVVADVGSSYNNWMAGGTMFTGKLADSGTRNSFLDTFHRSFNGLNGDWFGSQQDATVTNQYRLGTGAGNERGLLNRYQTDYGYRWTTGLSDATVGEQFYQILDELNNVYRLSIGQYNNGQSSSNNQTVVNSAGTGAVVLNGANNAGTGGVIFGSGGPSETTVATISNAGNAQFNGALQVGGTSQSTGTMTVRNSADAEVDYYLWPGLTTSQKGSFTYKDWNGNSQWYLVKDASNNWALNSATGGLDSFKAYQNTNSGDTYVNSSNSTGHIRLNYESGSGAETDIYSGSSANLDAAFLGPTSIKFPGLAASSGHSCLQVDASGYLTNTGAACGSGGSSGTIDSGNSGQIAYYTSSGTSIGGMSAVPLNAGGTGANSASGALANLGALSVAATAPQTIAGPLTGPSVIASVNSQINVMAPPYNARGDCSSDDQAAINSALRAADAFAVGSSGPATVYFPKPPGGCYLTSTLAWYGEPLQGSGPGVTGAAGYGGVELRGKPGQDILNPGDPTTSNLTFYYPPSIENIVFKVDDSVTPNFPHRWPGRWVDDGTMTANSAVFKSSRALIDCSDVGQAIQVNGAGPSGSNLVTTIASVAPCWNQGSLASGNWQVITLANAASTTVTNAHTYVSVGDLPVTANLGNCAIAFDDKDANTADWVNPSANTSLYESSFRNVTLTSTSGANNGQNKSCGLYTQGLWQLYAVDANFLSISRLYYGVVQASAELNSYNGSFGDFEKWSHIQFNGATYPWISYDGGFNELSGWQLYSVYGPQILGVVTLYETPPAYWTISIPESEGGGTGEGLRLIGKSHLLKNTGLSGVGQSAFLETSNLIAEDISLGSGTTYIDGDHNTINLSANGTANKTFVNRGLANSMVSNTQGQWYDNVPTSQPVAVLPTKGTGIAGQQTSDFIQSGNAAAPYASSQSLFFWPQDALPNSAGSHPYDSYIISDPASMSGNDFIFSSGYNSFESFAQFISPTNTAGLGIIGTNIPAVPSTIYFQAKCASSTTSVFQIEIFNSGGFVAYQQLPFSCTTSFASYSLAFDFTSYTGDWVNFANPGGRPTTRRGLGFVPTSTNTTGSSLY